MVAQGTLPHQLKLLLSHPRVKKVGRLVAADLKYLQSSCPSTSKFVGAVDLAVFAKEKHVIQNARCSLADLCASILNKRLNKNVSERISQSWENEELTQQQLRYAAMDAYASLQVYDKSSQKSYKGSVPNQRSTCLCRIYEALAKIHAPCSLPDNACPLIPVLLYGDDRKTIIAAGQLSPHMNDRSLDGINITPSRTVVDITQLCQPGAMVSSHHKKPLNSFGNTPFSIVCLRSHCHTYDPTSLHLPVPFMQQRKTSTPNPVDVDQPSTSSQGHLPILEDGTDDDTSIGHIIMDNITTTESTLDYPREADATSHATGNAILGTDPEKWDNLLRSRVLKDPFHVFNMFRSPRHHGLRVAFARALRDAIFIPDPEDRRRIELWGSAQKPPLTFEQIRATHPAWLWKRCKRIIPPPNILYPAVANVLRTYGPLRDAASRAPLFNHNTWQIAKHILELIKNGFLSDPPDTSALYSYWT